MKAAGENRNFASTMPTIQTILEHNIIFFLSLTDQSRKQVPASQK
jgi:hypothetical protein